MQYLVLVVNVGLTPLLCVAMAGVIMSSSDNAMKYRGLEMSKYVNFTATQVLVMVLSASKSSLP